MTEDVVRLDPRGVVAVDSMVQLMRTHPWHGTAPGPLTARIWGVPMRAARSYGLGARIADVRREQSIIDGINWIASGERCMWCGETDCAHPLH